MVSQDIKWLEYSSNLFTYSRILNKSLELTMKVIGQFCQTQKTHYFSSSWTVLSESKDILLFKLIKTKFLPYEQFLRDIFPIRIIKKVRLSSGCSLLGTIFHPGSTRLHKAIKLTGVNLSNLHSRVFPQLKLCSLYPPPLHGHWDDSHRKHDGLCVMIIWS